MASQKQANDLKPGDGIPVVRTIRKVTLHDNGAVDVEFGDTGIAANAETYQATDMVTIDGTDVSGGEVTQE